MKSVIRIRGRELTLTRRGPMNVQMNFAQGKKTLTRYQTPYGVMTIGLDTDRVECQVSESGLSIEVDYALEANYQYVADCAFRSRSGKRAGNGLTFSMRRKGNRRNGSVPDQMKEKRGASARCGAPFCGVHPAGGGRACM